jgi:hypothetical protein
MKMQRSKDAKMQRDQSSKVKVQRSSFCFQLSAFSFHLSLLLCFFVSCSGDQFAGWHVESFDTTQITSSTQKTIYIGNSDSTEEQHIRGIGFDKGSNAAGHFRIDTIKIGEQSVGSKDIIIPPGGALAITITYAPLNMETTFADYGGWETGKPDHWIPHKPGEEPKKDKDTAIHRAILQTTYDVPRQGVVQIELVGQAIAGPHGETEAGGKPGECTVGDGIACYTGGFAIDIPKLYSGGPRELTLTGALKLTMSGGEVTLRMDDFPPALMILKSTEIPQLPSGVTGTLIISGALGKTATGTFDGSRITLKDVVFRIRFVLGEVTADDITPGMASMIDFEIPNLEIDTIEPLTQGAITMHLETTLNEAPSGNQLFDQFLSKAKVVVIMKGQLSF